MDLHLILQVSKKGTQIKVKRVCELVESNIIYLIKP